MSVFFSIFSHSNMNFNENCAEFEQICRLCTKSNRKLYNIYSKYEDLNCPISEAVMECIPIQISMNDGLPVHICSQCIYKICYFNDFRMVCMDSDIVLREYQKTILSDNGRIEFVSKESSVGLEDNKDISTNSDNNVEENSNIVKAENSKIYFESPPCCEKCRMTFVSRTNLIRHLRTHSGEKPFSCEICGKKFATQAYVKSHMVIHTKERKFSCEMCGKTFMFNSDLTIHMRKHTGERPYVCETCAKRFVSSSALNAHRFKHGPKRFFCIVCTKGFTYKLELDSHILIHRKDTFVIKNDENIDHEMNSEQTSEVIYPNKAAKLPIQISQSKYDQYLKLIEKLGKETFVCDVCNKVLSSCSNLYRHKLIHTGLKRHMCEICGKGFKVKTDLTDHKNRHLGIRNIQCEFCPKMFASRSDYGKHVSTHMDHKPFVCDVCSKSYYNVYALNHHKKEHQYPFKCKHLGCLKAYPNEEKLERHFRLHDKNKRRFNCDNCDKIFTSVQSLTRHTRNVHSGTEEASTPMEILESPAATSASSIVVQ